MKKAAKEVAVPAPEKYVQQVHKDCGGEIVVCAGTVSGLVHANRLVVLACRRCKTMWHYEDILCNGSIRVGVPNDFVDESAGK